MKYLDFLITHVCLEEKEKQLVYRLTVFDLWSKQSLFETKITPKHARKTSQYTP